MESEHDKAASAFQEEVQRVLQRFRLEWNLSYAAAIGMLAVTALDLYMELREEERPGDPEDSDA